jgi:hypothetical protein
LAWEADYIFVLGPKSSLVNWKPTLELAFDMDRCYLGTIDGWKFCGTKKKPSLKQPYIYSVNRKGKGVDYYPSDTWKELVDENRVILIVDEFQMIKNPSQRTFAVAAASRYITLNENNSRTIFLSYTPSDKLEMTSIHMYVMGIICNNEKDGKKSMVQYDRKKRKWIATGLGDTLEFLKRLDEPIDEYKKKVKDVLTKGGTYIHKQANILAGNIFLDVIRKHIVFSCKPPFMEDENLIPNYESLYCKVSNQTAAAVLKILRKGSSYFEPNDQIRFKHLFDDPEANKSFGKLVKIHDSLEKIKCDIYIQLALEFFEMNPTGKVIIMVQFLENLDTISEALENMGYGVVTLEGSMSVKKRAAAIEAFQQHNTKIQAIVGTIGTSGVAVSLHDTSKGGKFPRQVLIPPCPRVIDVVQSSGRAFRDGVTSKPTISIVYTADKDIDVDNAYSLENKFYENVWNKSKTIKRYHAEGQEDPLPCDYDIYITDKVYSTFLDDDEVDAVSERVEEGEDEDEEKVEETEDTSTKSGEASEAEGEKSEKEVELGIVELESEESESDIADID